MALSNVSFICHVYSYVPVKCHTIAQTPKKDQPIKWWIESYVGKHTHTKIPVRCVPYLVSGIQEAKLSKSYKSKRAQRSYRERERKGALGIWVEQITLEQCIWLRAGASKANGKDIGLSRLLPMNRKHISSSVQRAFSLESNLSTRFPWEIVGSCTGQD